MFLLALFACNDLPPDWSKAQPIADFTQKACEGSAYDTGIGDPVLTAAPEAGGVSVEVGPVMFRCEQKVEGFWLAEGDVLQVLVQPENMNPTAVAGCDCLYDLSMLLPEGGEAVEVWTRGDHESGLDEPELAATGEVAADAQ